MADQLGRSDSSVRVRIFPDSSIPTVRRDDALESVLEGLAHYSKQNLLIHKQQLPARDQLRRVRRARRPARVRLAVREHQ